jgi:hypothetical protein
MSLPTRGRRQGEHHQRRVPASYPNRVVRPCVEAGHTRSHDALAPCASPAASIDPRCEQEVAGSNPPAPTFTSACKSGPHVVPMPS